MSGTPREPWLERSVALLDQSAEALDAATLSRLTQARHAAAELARTRRPQRWRRGLIAAAGIATCALALGIALRAPHGVPTPVPAGVSPPAAVDALAADEDDFDMYEDLDFYAWLDAEQDGRG